jgi:hypothetical protein
MATTIVTSYDMDFTEENSEFDFQFQNFSKLFEPCRFKGKSMNEFLSERKFNFRTGKSVSLNQLIYLWLKS